jgi:hypothetical protein
MCDRCQTPCASHDHEDHAHHHGSRAEATHHAHGREHCEPCDDGGHDLHHGCDGIDDRHRGCHCGRRRERGDGRAGKSRRPTKTVGTSRGRFDDPAGLRPGDFSTDNPPDSWAGPRQDLYLPFLFLRANPGDLGGRPVSGPFWESPDIFILAGIDAATAPAIPPALGQTGLAGQPNTLYAHVWNFGNASAPQVVVEFYWCDPTLGIGPASAHLIGQTIVSLGAKGSGQSHAVVKCPESWTPTYVNGGHECLVVRAWDYTADALGAPPWDASLNRHVGQRNIHVERSGGLGAARALGTARPASAPLVLRVGPLYGEPADVNVARVNPNEMPWLQLHTGVRGQFPTRATPSGSPLLSPPTSVGGGPSAAAPATAHQVAGDDQQIAFSSSDDAPGPGEAHVYRVTASQGDQVVGGYTVVRLG